MSINAANNMLLLRIASVAGYIILPPAVCATNKKRSSDPLSAQVSVGNRVRLFRGATMRYPTGRKDRSENGNSPLPPSNYRKIYYRP